MTPPGFSMVVALFVATLAIPSGAANEIILPDKGLLSVEAGRGGQSNALNSMKMAATARNMANPFCRCPRSRRWAVRAPRGAMHTVTLGDLEARVVHRHALAEALAQTRGDQHSAHDSLL